MHKVTADTSPKSMVTFGNTSHTWTLNFHWEEMGVMREVQSVETHILSWLGRIFFLIVNGL